ncbi:MAG: 23S rRNA (uracil(1939)-C(5))-methyltransferase RlmD [Erysipelotrichaceae bacterium]|nr:23S rRNA (uracil(1939)-C(5))-methyltransferase RlmD [Erysipelotrichaceae bacterium]
MEIQKNQVIDSVCIDYTYDGLGVVKYGTFSIFVKDMAIGDKGKVIITALRKNYAYGRLLELTESSKYRTQPRCPYSKICGGCQLQHLSAQGQKDFKQGIVENNIRHIGKLDNEINPVMVMDDPWHYRNKIIFPVTQDKDGKCVIGFYRYNSHDIIEVKDCCLQSDKANRLLRKMKELIDEYDLASHIRNIMIRDMVRTDSMMLVIVTDREEVDLENLVRDVISFEPSIRSVIQNINPDKTNVVLGKKEKLLYGSETIEDVLCGFRFQISSKSFYQVNTVQTEVLYNTAFELAGITKADELLDLYCGVGTIGMIASRFAGHVTGVEIVESAVENARENARANGIENIEFICGDAQKITADLMKQGKRFEAAVIDPPRKGCSAQTIQTLIDLSIDKLIYISCNPATLARDLEILKEYYEIRTIQPVDMFPQTYHVESVVLMSRAGVEATE